MCQASEANNHQPRVKIRRREHKDLPACVKVLERVYNQDGYPVQGTAHAESFLSNQDITSAWVAVIDSKIVGHVAIGKAKTSDLSAALWRKTHQDDAIAVLERLFVDPDSRGSGVVAKLVQAAVAWGAERGMRLVLYALAKDIAAARLYERLGWAHFGTATYRYGDGQEMDAWGYSSPTPKI
ncbi:hypothetical protein CB0940_06280 [Cercospora beticola]|uniref:N-acetyltransferase domain-containing protein n=1 Tax=Cercospora beticola TaxID=122368 RepID=A0A2G5HYJ7_CERBT|nr:hypothetical protein CB0940_06280 [Cercospora beticola]PIA97600.1 hypothetical protein CB0940_06280 [Cercospora beticola]WPA98899.1 hypothetical protein RHO25_003512 [Cercospora beticola]CAK1360195.1 unnamed protein product [Cercospora beticola]